jgi:hypothetical protein
VKKYLTSLAVRKMKITTTFRFHFSPVTMLSSRKQKQQMLKRMWGEKEPLYTVGMNVRYSSSMGISMKIPQKIKYRATISPTTPLLAIYSQKSKVSLL